MTKKSLLFWTWDDWKLLDDATVIMRDDTIKVEISKKDLTTMEELPGAELTITDKDGKEIDRWVSTDKPHYIEKLPAGEYTLTEVKAPDGYAFAESVSTLITSSRISNCCTLPVGRTVNGTLSAKAYPSGAFTSVSV